MPHLAFFATFEDVTPIMRFVLSECHVFERVSAPNATLRRFTTPLEVQNALDERDVAVLNLMLYTPSMGGEFRIERFELKPGAIPVMSWREQIAGWGMIQLQFSVIRGQKLRPSFTNHNSENRAQRWANTSPHIPSVDAWDFREVVRISRRINRYITSLAIRKIGSKPILPAANAMVAKGEITLEAN